MTAYYNEIDPYAAEWLRNLILCSLIAPGEVDERSIVDVRPSDLRGFTQCHFFAGIGGWSLALRLAGWPDERPAWTGSCPCQPFSTAGRGNGFADERHLWPYWHYLIEECRPAVVFGEQVEAAIRLGWLDLVQADLEGLGYAFGAAGLPAACVGAPHIRQRLWFVGHTDLERVRGEPGTLAGPQASGGYRKHGHGVGAAGAAEFLADSSSTRLEGCDGRALGRERTATERSSGAGALADDDAPGRGLERLAGLRRPELHDADGCSAGFVGDPAPSGRPQERASRSEPEREGHRLADAGVMGRPWADVEWLPCRDGKARPTQPTVQFVADGLPASLGRVRPEQLAALTQEVIHAATGETRAREAMRDVLEALEQEALRGRPARGLDGVHSAQVLLAFLRQLAAQGWHFSECIPSTSAQVAEARMRVLWGDEETPRPPRERGLGGQPVGERADTVRLLSSVLAQHAQEAWGAVYAANAAVASPLAHGVPARVGKLRAAGNAIVPQVGAEFVKAFMECRP